jgi:hypothetical protein
MIFPHLCWLVMPSVIRLNVVTLVVVMLSVVAPIWIGVVKLELHISVSKVALRLIKPLLKLLRWHSQREHLWTSYNFPQTSYELIANFIWRSYEYLAIFLQTSWKILRELLTNDLKTSYELSVKFLKMSYKLKKLFRRFIFIEILTIFLQTFNKF